MKKNPVLPPLNALVESLLAAFAMPYTQENRLVRLRFSEDSGIAPDTLLAHRVIGHEAVSEPFSLPSKHSPPTASLN